MPKALIIAILIIVLLPITKAEKTIAYTKGDTPVRIIIPEVSIDLKVTKSEIIGTSQIIMQVSEKAVIF